MFLNNQSDGEEQKDLQIYPISFKINPIASQISESDLELEKKDEIILNKRLSLQIDSNPRKNRNIQKQRLTTLGMHNQMYKINSLIKTNLPVVNEDMKFTKFNRNKTGNLMRLNATVNKINQANQDENREKSNFKNPKYKMHEILKEFIKKIINYISDYSIEDSRLSNFYYRKVMIVEYSCMYFAMMGLFLSFLYQDHDYYANQNDIYADTKVTFWLLWMVQFSTMLTSKYSHPPINNYQYLINIEYGKRQHIIAPFDNLISTKQYQSLLFEPYPFINQKYFDTYELYHKYTYQFKYNYLLCFLMCSRLYIPIRVLLHRMYYMNPRASRLCRVYGCQASYMFVIKCTFKDYAILLSVTNIGFGLIFFSLAFRMFERPIQSSFENFETSLWLSLVTMTTVGYGDFKPFTLCGRLVSMILIVWGSFSTTLIVVAVKNITNVDAIEQRVITVFNKLNFRQKLIKSASSLISLQMIQHYRGLGREGLSKMNSFRKNFRDSKESYKNIQNNDDLLTELTREFEFIIKSIAELTERQKKIKTIIGNVKDSEFPQKIKAIYDNKFRKLFIDELCS